MGEQIKWAQLMQGIIMLSKTVLNASDDGSRFNI